MKKDKKKYKPITLELAVAAQSAYAEAIKKEASGGGEKSQLALNPGWGGKGR